MELLEATVEAFVHVAELHVAGAVGCEPDFRNCLVSVLIRIHFVNNFPEGWTAFVLPTLFK